MAGRRLGAARSRAGPSSRLRKRDAAELVARGYSNKAIAAELVLPVRSMENRLQHVYEKLAISGRAELTEALRVERA
jgi:DNA-binding NarL/FixJ family response regulator